MDILTAEEAGQAVFMLNENMIWGAFVLLLIVFGIKVPIFQFH